MSFVQSLDSIQTFSRVVFDWNYSSMTTKFFMGGYYEQAAMDAMARVQEQTASTTGISVNSAEAVAARELEGEQAFWAEVRRLNTLDRESIKWEGRSLAQKLYQEHLDSGMHGQRAAGSVLDSISRAIADARAAREG